MSVFDPVEQECLHKASRDSYKKRYPPALSPEQQAIIPDPAIFNSLTDIPTNLFTGADVIIENKDASLQIAPSSASCAVHLELLEAFMVLRMLVIKSGWLDKSLGVLPAKRNDSLLAKTRPLKWIPAVVLAVVRFEAWWSIVDTLLRTNGNAESSVKQLTVDTLPPLDVLMVWHGYMLNPKPYREDCIKHGRSALWEICFPWKILHEAIDFSSRKYTLSATAISAFETATGFTANLLDHLKSLEPLPNGRLSSLTAGCRLTVQPQAIEALRQHWSLPSKVVYPSSIELIGATLRQGRFVDTMSHHLWIRSPSLPATLSRARARYVQYFSLLAFHPGKAMIPTIEIDLVWHTHQLSPSAYYDFSISATGGRFINHSDTIDNTVRRGGLGVVRDLWWRNWGEEYARCFCWDCELLLTLTEQRQEGKGPAGGLEGRAVVEARAKKVEVVVGFYRAVEQARRKGDMLPAMIG